MITKPAAAALLLATVPAVAGVAAIQETAATQETAAVTTTHTRRLLLQRTGERDLDQQHSVGTDRVRSRGTGRVVGFDTFSARSASDHSVFRHAFALKRGILLVRFRDVDAAPARFAGRVIGGTGVFDGATGAVRGRSVGTGESVFTIRYSL